MSGPARGRCGGRNLPLLTSGCTYGFKPSLSTPSAFVVSFDAVLGRSTPADYSQAIPLSLCLNMSAYLPGLPLRVPQRLRKVRELNPRLAVEQYRSYVVTALLCCRLTTQPTFPCMSFCSFVLCGFAAKSFFHALATVTVGSPTAFLALTSPLNLPSLIIL